MRELWKALRQENRLRLPPELPRRAPGLWAGAYALFLLTVFPLYVGPEGYSSMVVPKFRLLLGSAAVFFPVLALLLGIRRWKSGKTQGAAGSFLRERAVPLALAAGLLVWFLLSSLLSPYPDTVWLGSSRREGFVTLAVYLGIFAVFTCLPVLGSVHRWAAALTAGITLLLVIPQFLGNNPLGLYPQGYNFHHRGLRYAGEYLGTIGNSDLLSGLLTMLSLYLLGDYVTAEKENRPVSLFGGLCAWSALVCSEVTAGPVAVLGAFAVALPVCVKKGLGLRRLGDVALALVAPVLLKSVTGYTAPEGQVSFFFQWTALSWGLLALVILTVVAMVLLRRLPEGRGFPRVSSLIWLGYGLVLAGVLGFLLLYSGSNETLLGLGNLLRGNPPDTLGSSRIAIWKDAVELGLEEPLFGGGPDTYNFRSDLSFTRTLPSGNTRTTTVDAAHNEYLNLWVNCGLPAMVLQVALVLWVTVRGLRKTGKATLALALPAVGYGIHALFGISQCLVSPVFYLFLGALAGATGRENTPSEEPEPDTATP